MTKRAKVRTVEINEGSWYALGNFDRDVCCDCCLVHLTEHKLENGKIMFRTVVDAAETAALRKEHGIKVTRKGK
jgi:hypothetical protein